jgi:hypoxanthine phosphoribosyltransferase
MMEQDMQEILFTPEALAQRVKELADQINRDYAGKSPMVVGTLRGSFVFMADLVRQINLPLTVDFLSASSYGSGTESSGQVRLKLDLGDDIAGRDVLIIEDIVDSGNTLSKLLPELQKRGPTSLKVCALLDKPERRVLPFQADYVGFTIPDAFVVGYGLDFNQHYRQLPYIGVLKPSVYE